MLFIPPGRLEKTVSSYGWTVRALAALLLALSAGV
jgi:hypothetical protein